MAASSERAGLIIDLCLSVRRSSIEGYDRHHTRANGPEPKHFILPLVATEKESAVIRSKRISPTEKAPKHFSGPFLAWQGYIRPTQQRLSCSRPCEARRY